jgi:hypothetical protein
MRCALAGTSVLVRLPPCAPKGYSMGVSPLESPLKNARAHDQTVADDYFRAVEQVEQKLATPLAWLKQAARRRQSKM